jgi:hypothetical protein
VQVIGGITLGREPAETYRVNCPELPVHGDPGFYLRGKREGVSSRARAALLQDQSVPGGVAEVARRVHHRLDNK